MIRESFRLVCVAATVAVCAAVPLPAQSGDTGGQWTDLGPALAPTITSGFPTPELETIRIHAYDTADMIRLTSRQLGVNVGNVEIAGWRTTDGGRTWATSTASPVLPAEVYDNGSAWRFDGRTSTDRGRSWKAAARVFASFVADATGLQVGLVADGAGNGQLITSTDGGASWSADLVPSFGALPRDAEMQSPTVRLVELVTVRGGLLTAIAVARGVIGQRQETRWYVGTLDLRTREARWSVLPFWRNAASPSARGPEARLRRVNDRVLIAEEYAYETFYGEYWLQAIWRSSDDGATWERRTDLEWIDPSTLEFFPPETCVSATALSTDAGATWQRRAAPFVGAFDAIDARTWVVVAPYSILAVTTDAGRTWRRSPHGAPALGLAASGQCVVIPREGRSVLRSVDSGSTWLDVGATDGLPQMVRRVVAVAWVDPVALPGQLSGVAAVVDAANQERAWLITSADTGRTWTLGVRLPGLDGTLGTEEVIDEPVRAWGAPGEDNVGRSLFVTGTRGVYRQDESGDVAHVVEAVGVQMLHMVDDRNGVMFSGDWTIPAIRILVTSDAGSTWEHVANGPDGFTFPVGLTYVDGAYRAILSNSWNDYQEWAVMTSAAGRFWTSSRHRHELPPLKGGDGFWQDARRVYVVGRGASILYSGDGGAGFSMHHEPGAGFFQPRRASDSVDIVFRPLLSACDGRRIYVATRSLLLGRWTIGDVPSRVIADEGESVGIELGTDGTSVLVTTASSAPVDVEIHDLLGRSVLEVRTTAGGRTRVISAGLKRGLYLVTARTDGRIKQRLLPLGS